MKINGFLLRSSLVAALGGLLFGFDTAVISGAEQNIQALWGLSPGMHGVAMAAALYGTVLGALLGGWPADRFGRHTHRDALRSVFPEGDLPTSPRIVGVRIHASVEKDFGCASAWLDGKNESGIEAPSLQTLLVDPELDPQPRIRRQQEVAAALVALQQAARFSGNLSNLEVSREGKAVEVDVHVRLRVLR